MRAYLPEVLRAILPTKSNRPYCGPEGSEGIYRKKGREEARFTPYTTEQSDHQYGAEDALLKRRLIDCLRKLNGAYSRHARILNLAYKGFRAPEISEKLNIKTNNVYVLLHRARRLLKECLETGVIAV